MPRGPKGERRPADVIGNAVHVMRIATGEIEEGGDRPIFDTAFEQRRLRFLNALFLAVARCGGKPVIEGREAREISVTIHQTKWPCRLIGHQRGVARRPGDSKSGPDALCHPRRLRPRGSGSLAGWGRGPTCAVHSGDRS